MPLVAFAAALWGLDGLLRKPLATALNPATVVLWEHLVVVLVVLPWVPRAFRAFRATTLSVKFCIALIGAGASALATALFTEAFKLGGASGDFITPLVLQKLQPVFAVLLAVVLLGERLRPAFLIYALPAFAGAWLLTFPHPFDVAVREAQVALCALGAAALWAAGTVLGRRASAEVSARDLTVLRYCWGLPAAWLITWQQDAPFNPGGGNIVGLVLLALIPGLFALRLYYVGLRRTAASRATFAELAFPATAAIVGVWFLGSTMTATQWAGFAVVIPAVSAMSLHEGRRRRPVVQRAEDRVLQPIGSEVAAGSP
jgi:drug/metabolite transporter (DMT)-like permease